MNFYDITFDEIRDHVNVDLTNQQISDVLDAYEDDYNMLSFTIGMGEDGREKIINQDELSELNNKIITALEREQQNG